MQRGQLSHAPNAMPRHHPECLMLPIPCCQPVLLWWTVLSNCVPKMNLSPFKLLLWGYLVIVMRKTNNTMSDISLHNIWQSSGYSTADRGEDGFQAFIILYLSFKIVQIFRLGAKTLHTLPITPTPRSPTDTLTLSIVYLLELIN